MPELHVVLVPSAQVIIFGFPNPPPLGIGPVLLTGPGVGAGLTRLGVGAGLTRLGVGAAGLGGLTGLGVGTGGLTGPGLGIAPPPGKKFDSGPVMSLERFQKAVGATVPGK